MGRRRGSEPTNNRDEAKAETDLPADVAAHLRKQIRTRIRGAEVCLHQQPVAGAEPQQDGEERQLEEQQCAVTSREKRRK